MFFKDIVGQEVAKHELRNSFHRGVVPHARLFVGDNGMGALALAYAYARYINCSIPSADDACGACPSCLRFSQFSSLDLYFLFPIVNVNSRNFCDDELPQWRQFLMKGAHSTYEDWLEYQGGEGKRLAIFTREGEQLLQKLSYQVGDARYRVLLVWLPERMNEALGNKLLKLVEEPPQQTIILMVSQDESAVLGTLRSRMQTLHLRPVEERQIVEALARQTSTGKSIDIADIAHRCAGNYRTALDEYLGVSKVEDELLAIFKRILRATVDAQPIQVRTLSDEIAKLGREEQISLLTYVTQVFREIFIASYDIRDISYIRPEEMPLVNYIKACVNGKNISEILVETDLAIRHISQNVNSKMVFFDYILKLTSILAPEYKAHGIR